MTSVHSSVLQRHIFARLASWALRAAIDYHFLEKESRRKRKEGESPIGQMSDTRLTVVVVTAGQVASGARANHRAHSEHGARDNCCQSDNGAA